MRVYLAGPMRGHPLYNFPAFDEAAGVLRASGVEVVSPAEMDRELGFDETADVLPTWFTLADALRRDFAELLGCDAIVLLPGWEASEGVSHELHVARVCGLEAYRYVPEAPEGHVLEPHTYGISLPQETTVVDPETGGAKGSKLARFDLLPPEVLRQLAEHYGRGAAKYEARNWERGYCWSLSFAALQRHAWAWWGGEDADPETGSSHLAAVLFHAAALLEFTRTHPEKDDRP